MPVLKEIRVSLLISCRKAAETKERKEEVSFSLCLISLFEFQLNLCVVCL